MFGTQGGSIHIDKVYNYIEHGKRVVVICAGGQSRSNAVALCVLIKQGMSFHEADKLIRKNPVAMIDMALYDLIRKIYVKT